MPLNPIPIHQGPHWPFFLATIPNFSFFESFRSMDYSTSSSQNSKNVIIGSKNPVVALLSNVSAWTLLLAVEHQHSHEILIIGASVWTTPF
jgi:hypothetical protein